MLQEVSVVPGRARIKYPKLKNNKSLAQAIKIYLDTLKGIKDCSVNIHTTSIIITYDPQNISFPYLKEQIINLINYSPKAKAQLLKSNKDHIKLFAKKQKAWKQLIFYSAIFVLFRIKQPKLGKYWISKNIRVLMLVSSVVIVSGYPLFNQKLTKSRKYIAFNPDLFLNTLAIFLTILRESNEGVALLALKSFNDYLRYHADFNNMKLLKQNIDPNWGYAKIYAHDGQEVLMPITRINRRDKVVIKSGEYIHFDGVVEAGEGLINTIYSTGQSKVKKVTKGSKVAEGSLLVSGNITINLLKQPQEYKKQAIFDLDSLEMNKRVGYFNNKSTWVAMGLTGLTLIISGNIYTAVSILLIFCPSGTGVSLSTGLGQYIGLLHRKGIYLRNIGLLEKIASTDYLIVDKTGTLTEQELELEKIVPLNSNYSRKELLQIASACEGELYHPIANTLKKLGSGPNTQGAVNVTLIPAQGVKAIYNNQEVLIGNTLLMKENEIELSDELLGSYYDFEQKLCTPLIIAIDSNPAGLIILREKLRKDALKMMTYLKSLGEERIILLTGDGDEKAQQISQQLEIKKIYSNCDYNDKGEIVNRYKKLGTVMMVGDGINDLLAMGNADISVSFAPTAFDKVKLHSDCVLLDHDLAKIGELLALSKKTRYLIEQSIDFSHFYNLGLGALAFFNMFSPFTAKTISTINPLLVLLLNQRISFLGYNKKL